MLSVKLDNFPLRWAVLSEPATPDIIDYWSKPPLGEAFIFIVPNLLLSPVGLMRKSNTSS